MNSRKNQVYDKMVALLIRANHLLEWQPDSTYALRNMGATDLQIEEAKAQHKRYLDLKNDIATTIIEAQQHGK